tara:strand:- start:514 stop:678 length:165 start_codon:yes stop_codon:yes gene_type:complete
MAKVLVRVPEPKEQYDASTQRQINRSISAIVQQLNTTYQQSVKEEQEQATWFLN